LFFLTGVDDLEGVWLVLTRCSLVRLLLRSSVSAVVNDVAAALLYFLLVLFVEGCGLVVRVIRSLLLFFFFFDFVPDLPSLLLDETAVGRGGRFMVTMRLLPPLPAPRDEVLDATLITSEGMPFLGESDDRLVPPPRPPERARKKGIAACLRRVESRRLQ